MSSRVYSLLLAFFVMSLGQTCPDGWYKESTIPNKCLKFVTEIQGWFGAKLDCGTMGDNSTLLAIDNAVENTEVAEVAQAGQDRCTQFYIDLFRRGSAWVWDNGDASQYVNWKTSYPTRDQTQNVGSLERSSGKWMNEDGTKKSCYICQQFI